MNIFVEWLRLREVDCGGLFKDYELNKVQASSADIAERNALSLNYWVSKFVLILWMPMIKGTGKVLC